ncbi:MAG TPA: protein-glutamate O-methyltransferase CheR [Bryobacteraceae bacterium]|nr:protein-glutamate O-methyltransferase CheR [Bryobacteraceae bacterium]
MHERQIAEIEREALLTAVFRRYGFDFREYARGSISRRIRLSMQQENVATISALQEKLLRDSACMNRFLLSLSISVTSMFRDPELYVSFRTCVVPQLRDLPFVRVWHAGCSTGQEAYSMAILLQEEGLYPRCRIYATDMNEEVLDRAKTGIFPLDAARAYSANYQKAGGKTFLADFYTARYENAILHASLRDNIVFAQHNLVTDGSFNEFDLIFCRNVLIYFNRTLQDRVCQLFHDSLSPSGVLGLGKKETLDYFPRRNDYQEVDRIEKLYRRFR